MITSLSWLKNHLSTKSNLNQIAERLTEIGLEVESVKSSNGNLYFQRYFDNENSVNRFYDLVNYISKSYKS